MPEWNSIRRMVAQAYLDEALLADLDEEPMKGEPPAEAVGPSFADPPPPKVPPPMLNRLSRPFGDDGPFGSYCSIEELGEGLVEFEGAWISPSARAARSTHAADADGCPQGKRSRGVRGVRGSRSPRGPRGPRRGPEAA